MPKLIANFVEDWIDHLAAQMKACWGDQVDSIPREKIPLRYFDSLRRRISIQPRDLKLSDVFVPPAVAPKTDWPTFAKKVRAGEDLSPHLSTDYASMFKPDGLLNDWGIYHFHLNMNPHPKKPYFLDRSGPLVMGFVTEDSFHAIGVYEHGKGAPAPWYKMELVETLHRNWPEAIKRFRVNGVSGEQHTEDRRKSCREQNFNLFTTVSDGTVYRSLGKTMSLSAVTTIEARIQADKALAKLEAWQSDLERELPQLLETLKERGYDGESDLTGKLEFTEEGCIAYLPEYSLRVALNYVVDEQQM